MPQLDALRAFAVTAVVFHHYVPGDWGPLADLGVKLFFVLSGFLITGILIRSRNLAESSDASMFATIKNFYIRRSLRIFPLYYFVVGVAVLFAVRPVFDYLPYLLSYTLNLKFAQQGYFINHFAHFWSLSVEEQFYLMWPWIVLFVPRSRLLLAAIVMIGLGPAYRIFLVLSWTFTDSEISGLASYVFTLAAFDTLGMGALLAILVHSDLPKKRLETLVNRAGLLGVTGIVLVVGIGLLIESWAKFILFDVLLGLAYAWLVFRAGQGFGGGWGRFLNLKPLRYVGRISYGVYVYHPLIRPLLAYGLGAIGIGFDRHSVIGFVGAVAATLLVSTVSWYALERPINGLKKRFPVER